MKDVTYETLAALKESNAKALERAEASIADLKESNARTLESNAQRIADLKESNAKALEISAARIADLLTAKLASDAQLAAARGTLSRRAAYELVLQSVFAASKMLSGAGFALDAVKGRFNATNTETWLFQNYAALLQSSEPTLVAAAECVESHFVDKKTQAVNRVMLYAQLSHAIHRAGLDTANLKMKPENDPSIDDARHRFFVCLLEKVLKFP